MRTNFRELVRMWAAEGLATGATGESASSACFGAARSQRPLAVAGQLDGFASSETWQRGGGSGAGSTRAASVPPRSSG
jgi:hypothetical protein